MGQNAAEGVGINSINSLGFVTRYFGHYLSFMTYFCFCNREEACFRPAAGSTSTRTKG